MVGVVLEEEVAISRQAEEPVALDLPLEGESRVDRAAAIDEITFALEVLAPDAVPALVLAFEEVGGPALVDALDQRGDARLVTGIAGAVENVIADLQTIPGVSEYVGHAIDVGLRRHALGGGFLGDLLPVFVHADEQVHVVVA